MSLMVTMSLNLFIKANVAYGYNVVKFVYKGKLKLNGIGVYLWFACGLQKDPGEFLLYTLALNAL